MTPPLNIRARKKARKIALQAIYQWQLVQLDINALLAQFLAHADNQDMDRDYFKKLVRETISTVHGLDDHISPFLDRNIEDVSPIELSILRLSTFELKNCLEIPYKVIINEGIELAKVFGADDSFRYINGVLDKVSATLRAVEMGGE
jgi:transcription antitermination protein NusB